MIRARADLDRRGRDVALAAAMRTLPRRHAAAAHPHALLALCCRWSSNIRHQRQAELGRADAAVAELTHASWPIRLGLRVLLLAQLALLQQSRPSIFVVTARLARSTAAAAAV